MAKAVGWPAHVAAALVNIMGLKQMPVDASAQASRGMWV